MEPYVLWFLLALGLFIAEMMTSTFYMMVLSIAMCVGGVAALMDMSPAVQLGLGAMASIVGVVLLSRWKARQPAAPQDDQPDIGQPVRVLFWREDGTARVHYRGADWDAEPESADMPQAGSCYIKALHGSILILSQHKPQ
ncbi:MAG TPA: NfeD family protein [Gallionella sp.]|nr:NfeD family protein [Gallionella sp.]